ncbi:MAG: hypothetical protein ABW101_14490 [Candidatus Thiodiazotropha sp.]
MSLGILILLMLITGQSAATELWIDDRPSKGSAAEVDGADKVVYIHQGEFADPRGSQDPSVRQVERTAGVVDTSGGWVDAEVIEDRILFTTPHKGHHWVYLEERYVDGDTLEVGLSKYRFYNRQGDIQESLLKEIRGRTNESKYGRDPVPAVPFEVVLQKPLQDHHVSCCIYSGDRIRAKVYHRQKPLSIVSLQTISDSGWSARFGSDEQGLVTFEIPRYQYRESGSRRGAKQYLLLVAETRIDEAGVFNNQPYQQIHYRMSLPIDFRPSPLEWAAKLPAFALLIGVALLSGFATFLYRLRIRRRRMVCT